VRVPSMRGSEWGHVLRALELTRAAPDFRGGYSLTRRLIDVTTLF
jgi:hypothetical protein